MSIVNIFTKQAPTINGFSFDAVLEDTFEATVEMTTYPLETGIRISDHRILQPHKWSLIGAISNNPLKVHLTDFFGGVTSNFIDNKYAAGIAGLSAGWLAGSDETRASSALDMLLQMMQQGEPFDADTGDVFLKNMIITKLRRTKDPQNENGLIFVADLQEVILLDRITFAGPPAPDELRDGDVSQSAISRIVNKGQKAAQEISDSVRGSVNGVLEAFDA